MWLILHTVKKILKNHSSKHVVKERSSKIKYDIQGYIDFRGNQNVLT
jgi:hypothetical protein